MAAAIATGIAKDIKPALNRKLPTTLSVRAALGSTR